MTAELRLATAVPEVPWVMAALTRRAFALSLLFMPETIQNMLFQLLLSLLA